MGDYLSVRVACTMRLDGGSMSWGCSSISHGRVGWEYIGW